MNLNRPNRAERVHSHYLPFWAPFDTGFENCTLVWPVHIGAACPQSFALKATAGLPGQRGSGRNTLKCSAGFQGYLDPPTIWTSSPNIRAYKWTPQGMNGPYLPRSSGSVLQNHWLTIVCLIYTVAVQLARVGGNILGDAGNDHPRTGAPWLKLDPLLKDSPGWLRKP